MLNYGCHVINTFKIQVGNSLWKLYSYKYLYTYLLYQLWRVSRGTLEVNPKCQRFTKIAAMRDPTEVTGGKSSAFSRPSTNLQRLIRQYINSINVKYSIASIVTIDVLWKSRFVRPLEALVFIQNTRQTQSQTTLWSQVCLRCKTLLML
jgi:hypothetical protein